MTALSLRDEWDEGTQRSSYVARAESARNYIATPEDRPITYQPCTTTRHTLKLAPIHRPSAYFVRKATTNDRSIASCPAINYLRSSISVAYHLDSLVRWTSHVFLEHCTLSAATPACFRQSHSCSSSTQTLSLL